MEGEIRKLLVLYMFQCHVLTIDVLSTDGSFSFERYKEKSDALVDKYTEKIMDIVWKDEE